MAEPQIDRTYGRDDLPCSSAGVLRELLRPDEVLLWSGQPAPGFLAPGQRVLFVFAIVIFGFGALTLGFAFPDAVFEGRVVSVTQTAQGLIFMVMGVVFGFGHAGLALRSAWTVYAITNQRALIIRGFLRQRVTFFAPEDLDEPLRLDRDAGYGHLIFSKRRKPWYYQDRDQRQFVGIGFFRVRDVAGVEAELVKLRARAGVAAAIDPALKPA